MLNLRNVHTEQGKKKKKKYKEAVSLLNVKFSQTETEHTHTHTHICTLKYSWCLQVIICSPKQQMNTNNMRWKFSSWRYLTGNKCSCFLILLTGIDVPLYKLRICHFVLPVCRPKWPKKQKKQKLNKNKTIYADSSVDKTCRSFFSKGNQVTLLSLIWAFINWKHLSKAKHLNIL